LLRARFVAHKTHFHFTTQLRFSNAVFASKTDFSQHTPQPLKTNFGCPLPHQNTCAHAQPDKVSPSPRPCAHARFCKNTLSETQLAAPRALCRESLNFALNWERASLPLFGVRLAVQRSPSLTSLRGAHSLLPLPKPPAPTRPPLARSQQFKTRRRSFSCKRTLT